MRAERIKSSHPPQTLSLREGWGWVNAGLASATALLGLSQGNGADFAVPELPSMVVCCMKSTWGMRMRRFSVAVIGFFLMVAMAPAARAVECPVASNAAPSEARLAFLRGDLDQAAKLYGAQIAQSPNDINAMAGLVETLLRQQKVQEAVDEARKAVAAAPKNAMALAALGDVQERAGEPWSALDTVRVAMAADPCNARVHLLFSELARLNSLYATALEQARIAHQLDPHDPEIRRDWIWTLPAADRMRELEAYLASPTGDDPDDIRHMQQLLDFMKKSTDLPHKGCHLTSTATSTELPFAYLMYDAQRIRAFGLNVQLNGEKAQLQIDTGAGGILVSRTVAQRAGLKPVSQTEMSGIGSKGYQGGYTAYADSIQIGGLTFKDCEVRVLDSRNVVDEDGLIGMDVFSNFLVTLDYPMRKLGLGPLPPRPGVAAAPPSLRSDQAPTGGGQDTNDAETSAADNSAAKAPGAPSPPTHGPYDRYVAPEMKDWTEVYRVGHQLLLPVILDKKVRKLFILDTGAWSTSVAVDAAREVTKVNKAGDQLQVKGISGRVQDTYLADEITFYFAHLGQKAEKIPAWDLSGVSKNTGLEVSGFIGANTIDLTMLQIDYRDGLIHFDYQSNRGWVHGGE
jgi:tetratricopeptide (TPR) repeat protein